MKLLIINNLSAGPGDSGIYDFIRMFSKADDEVVMRCINENSNLSVALADASRFDRVVVAGGDGTVAHACYELRYSGIPILIFPSGTANLISQNILQPSELPALAKLAREGETLQFDLGEFEFESHKVGFMMMAGCGFDAQIMSTAKNMKDRLGPLAYFRAALDHATPPVADIYLEVDGKRIETKGVGAIFMNFSKIQFDVSFGLENLPNDGMLDVCVLATNNAWELVLPALGAAIDRSGKTLEQSEALQYYRGREFKIATNPPLGVEYDGEASGLSTPFSARILQNATNLVVSEECLEVFGN